jgi:preprotein translocase subunit YajC
MTFKKGDKIQTEDGQAGEILFVDKDGLSAQVALARVSMKIRTEMLRMFEPQVALAAAVVPGVAKIRKDRRKKISACSTGQLGV